MVCESTSKGLVVQGKKASSSIHPKIGKTTLLYDCYSNSHFCPLILFKIQDRSPFVKNSLP
jgi:hypothetical protein